MIISSVIGQLVVGLRFAFNLTFLGIVLSELFASQSGLGVLLQRALGSFDSEMIMAVTTVLVAIALVVNVGFYTIQRTLETRWNIDTEGESL